MTGVGQDIEDRAENEIDAHGRHFRSGRFSYTISEVQTPSSGDPHSTGKLADVVLVEQAVDAAIFLVQGDQQRDGMAGLMGDDLELLDKICRLLSSWGEVRDVSRGFSITCVQEEDRTLRGPRPVCSGRGPIYILDS